MRMWWDPQITIGMWYQVEAQTCHTVVYTHA